MPTCRDCAHYRPLEGDPERGTCRRHAPAPVVLPLVPDATWRSGGNVLWPGTDAGGSCGEWRPQPAEGLKPLSAVQALLAAADDLGRMGLSGLPVDVVRDAQRLLRERAAQMEGRA